VPEKQFNEQIVPHQKSGIDRYTSRHSCLFFLSKIFLKKYVILANQWNVYVKENISFLLVKKKAGDAYDCSLLILLLLLFIGKLF
jgi:hypothetical protein